MVKHAEDLILIDREKCNRDCICELECPFDLIYYGEDGYPRLRRAAKKHCIACGHCVSVCPSQALDLKMLRLEHCTPIDRKIQPTPEQVAQFLKSRRSIRTFKKKPVRREDLEWMLDVARYAPSAHNLQPVRWIMINHRETIDRLTGCVVDWMADMKLFPGVVRAWRENHDDKVLRHAPHLAVAYAPENGESPSADCSIACTYLELAGHSLGVGACWAGFLVTAVEYTQSINEVLGIPEGHRIYGALMLGYTKFRYYMIPDRNPVQVDWID
ncbi:MAG: nitroreductase family protein [Desulfovibrio sp.]